MNGFFVVSSVLFLLCVFAQGRPSDSFVWLMIFGAACALGGYGICSALTERKARERKLRKATR